MGISGGDVKVLDHFHCVIEAINEQVEKLKKVDLEVTHGAEHKVRVSVFIMYSYEVDGLGHEVV